MRQKTYPRETDNCRLHQYTCFDATYKRELRADTCFNATYKRELRPYTCFYSTHKRELHPYTCIDALHKKEVHADNCFDALYKKELRVGELFCCIAYLEDGIFIRTEVLTAQKYFSNAINRIPLMQESERHQTLNDRFICNILKS